MDYNPPVSSVHGIFQAKILECVAISSSRGSSWPGDQTRVSRLQADTLPSKPPGKPDLDSMIKKNRDITLPEKVHPVKAMVFPVVMYGCESWTRKTAEHWRIDAFELWCWRRLVRVPWTARRSNHSILKEISPECSVEGLMLKLKLQSFSHPMWRVDPLEKTLMLGGMRAGGEGDDRGWDGWMAS